MTSPLDPSTALPSDLRRRATAIHVIGASPLDRSTARRKRLGASLLLALVLGREPLSQAMWGPIDFPVAMGNFLLVFVATVAGVRVLGNLYDGYCDEIAAADRAAQAESAAMAATADGDQPAPDAGEGLGFDR